MIPPEPVTARASITAVKHDDTGLELIPDLLGPRRARGPAAVLAALLLAGLTSAPGCGLSRSAPGQLDAPPAAPGPATADGPDGVLRAVPDAAALGPDSSPDAGMSKTDVPPDAPAPSGAAEPSLDEACTAYARVFCAHYKECGPEGLQIFYGSNDICVARAAIQCKYAYASILGAHLGSAFVARCTHALDSPGTPCAVFLTRTDLLPDCKPAPGDLPNAAPCTVSAQCQSLTCTKTGSCGVCIPAPAVGDACQDDSQCVQMLGHPVICGRNGTCVEAGGINDICSDYVPCDESAFFCGVGGRCQALGRAGAPCSPGSLECDVNYGFDCLPTATGSTASTCQPIVQVAPGGDCSGGFCTGGSWCNHDKCTPFTPDGQPCPSRTSDECLTPARCIEGRCTLPLRPACVLFKPDAGGTGPDRP